MSSPPAEVPPSHRRPRAALVLLAAGEGRRAEQHTNKVLVPLAGRRVFTWSIASARRLPDVTRTVLVIRPADAAAVREVLAREVDPPPVQVVAGGDTRHASEWGALQTLAPDIATGEIDVVVIHDAARPLAGTEVFADVIRVAADRGGAIPVRHQGHVASAQGDDTPPAQVVAVQTPQAFLARPLLEAYRRAADDDFVGTDTASCIERYTDLPVWCVPGDAGNIKITFPEDVMLAERLLGKARDSQPPPAVEGAPHG